MKKLALCFALLLTVLFSMVQAEEDYWQQFVHYRMDVTLLPLEHALIGDATIFYKNNSPDTLKTLYFHLYPNAYRDENSIRAQEARRFHRHLVPNPADAGYLNIESLYILAPDSADGSRAVAAFRVDDTVLTVDLPQALPPGGDLTLKLSFYHKVRKFSGRAGYHGFQYDFAQWYPKICVYDETGWNNEPFHYLGEFYGEFGTFDVTINVPAEYVVAATGVVTAGDPGWSMVAVDTTLNPERWQAAFVAIKKKAQAAAATGKLRQVTFHAENVHDFAWVTSPDFLYESGEWDGIPIHVLYRSRVKERWSKKVVSRARAALAWLSEKFGRYPYPQLSVTHGLLGGGMEYPMLVMNSSESESLILHEVGHIYFYGILANNEWKEAWLDEGFTSFQTRWYRETKYGEWGFDREASMARANWLQKHRPSATSRMRGRQAALAYINSGKNEPISKPAYTNREPLGYRRNAYTKGAFFYDMLKYVVGDSAFGEICRSYFERWKFKHVNQQRFQRVCEEVYGDDLDWFFTQWLHDSVAVDYALAGVSTAKLDDGWMTEVVILRKEKGRMPVEVAVTTKSGESIRKRWPGFDKIGRLTFQTNEKPSDVRLDPDDRILDNTLFNNGRPKTRVLFDYPNLTYRPRDAYLITWRPVGWYNSVDGLKPGVKFRALQDVTKSLDVTAWYGVDSQALDARLRFHSKIKAMGPRTGGTVMAQKNEGRFEVDAHLSFTKSKYLAVPPFHRVWLGFNHSQLVGSHSAAYVLRTWDQKTDVKLPLWEEGIVNKLYGRYTVDPRGQHWATNVTFGFDTVQKDWGSDFTYNTLFSEIKLSIPGNTEGLFLRIFAKKVFQPLDAPMQDLVFLDGANPRERFKRSFLRSSGALPNELHYHLPGGGNMRGFYNQPIFGDQILAANVEFRQRLNRRSGRGLRSLLGTASVALFADFASLEKVNSSTDLYADAGFGFRFHRIIPDNWLTLLTRTRNLTLRLDFPLWVNRPLPDENAFRFRWVLGFEQAI